MRKQQYEIFAVHKNEMENRKDNRITTSISTFFISISSKRGE